MTRMAATGAWVAWLAGAYVIGATPVGLLIGLWCGVDIRTAGSGNVGATNVGRIIGKKWGLLCFALDVGKGAGPVLAFGCWAGVINRDVTAGGAGQWIAVGAAAVVGHVFSFWLKFKGGKGVATGLGAVLGVWPVLTCAAAAAGVVWLLITRATGYVSLASVIAAALLPIAAVASGLAFGLRGGAIAVFTAVTAAMALLVIARHRANLARLRAGTESKASWTKRGEAR